MEEEKRESIFCNSTCPTCKNSMVVIPAQPDPSELLQLVALWVPNHHKPCMKRCSVTLSPGDGDTAIVCSYLHILRGVRLHFPHCKRESHRHQFHSQYYRDPTHFPTSISSTFSRCIFKLFQHLIFLANYISIYSKQCS